MTPVGGADMPVVISLLNSYSGLAAAATGFVLANNALIIAGSLVGASGAILTTTMCRAMNRSLISVLLGGGGVAGSSDAGDIYEGKITRTTADEVAMLLETARRVVIVPGYGMAVAQAQHAASSLAALLGHAQTVVVIKRSLSPGFAGVPNPLFIADNTLMLFDDGRKALQDLVTATKQSRYRTQTRSHVALER